MDTIPIAARLQRIKDAVQMLREFQPLSSEQFSADKVALRVAEREFQIAIQAAIDIGEYILAELGTERPEDYADVFMKLADVGVVSDSFASELAAMARFRNILVHMYLDIDVSKVYDSVQNGLGDFETYAANIVAFLEQHAASGET